MGFIRERRPVVFRGGAVTSTGSTATGTDLVGSLWTDGGFRFGPVETHTLAAAIFTLNGHGTSILTYASSGGPRDAILPDPEYSGQQKEIWLIQNTSSVEAQIHAQSTASVFAGTTFNQIAIAASTVAPAGTAYLKLCAVSTSQWAVTVGSTINWDFSASTGSTGEHAGD